MYIFLFFLEKISVNGSYHWQSSMDHSIDNRQWIIPLTAVNGSINSRLAMDHTIARKIPGNGMTHCQENSRQWYDPLPRQWYDPLTGLARVWSIDLGKGGGLPETKRRIMWFEKFAMSRYSRIYTFMAIFLIDKPLNAFEAIFGGVSVTYLWWFHVCSDFCEFCDFHQTSNWDNFW